MNTLVKELGVIAAGIIGLAMFAVLVGQKSKSTEVIRAGGGAFAHAISAAVSPVTGGAGVGTYGGMGYY